MSRHLGRASAAVAIGAGLCSRVFAQQPLTWPVVRDLFARNNPGLRPRNPIATTISTIETSSAVTWPRQIS